MGKINKQIGRKHCDKAHIRLIQLNAIKTLYAGRREQKMKVDTILPLKHNLLSILKSQNRKSNNGSILPFRDKGNYFPHYLLFLFIIFFSFYYYFFFTFQNLIQILSLLFRWTCPGFYFFIFFIYLCIIYGFTYIYDPIWYLDHITKGAMCIM